MTLTMKNMGKDLASEKAEKITKKLAEKLKKKDEEEAPKVSITALAKELAARREKVMAEEQE